MNVVDHCNLNGKGCAHFSNIYDNNCVDSEQYKSDLKIISEKFNLYYFRILSSKFKTINRDNKTIISKYENSNCNRWVVNFKTKWRYFASDRG